MGKAKWISAVTVGDFWINYVTGIVSFIEQLWGSYWWTLGVEERPFGKAMWLLAAFV